MRIIFLLILFSFLTADAQKYYSQLLESDRQLEFEADASGKVVKIWFINNGQKGEMKKIE